MKKLFLCLILMGVFLSIGSSLEAMPAKEGCLCKYKAGSKCKLPAVTVEDGVKCGGKESFNDFNADYFIKDNYIERNYAFIPEDSDNPQKGYGVINGLFQYNPNNPLDPIFIWYKDNTKEYTDYDEWLKALSEIGISHPEELYK